MFKKIISFLIISSFIFNSHLSEIIVFASEIDKKEVVQTVKNLVSDYEIEDEILIKYKGKDRIVNIPEGVKYIGKEAFKNNDSVEVVNIHDNVRVIEKNAFEKCSNLKFISMPESIQLIEDYVFKDCENLMSITIPSGVSHLDKNIF